MKLSTLTTVEIILFNLAIIFVFQPRFIFSILRIGPVTEKTMRIIFTGLGIVTICFLFAWSFYFGAILFLFKQSVLN
ncbi:MAG: hypothetical protein NTY22_09090 [Proteobacteria bacterium]|nr:hypothetical protein [Pseudomonadota bacterium]